MAKAKQSATKFELSVSKAAVRSLTPEKMDEQMKVLKAKAINATRIARGWSLKVESNGWKPTKLGEQNVYRASLTLICKPQRERAIERINAEFEQISKSLAQGAKSMGWHFEGGPMLAANDLSLPDKYADITIPEEWREHYTNIYERDDQIDIVLSAIAAGVRSNWEDRFHTLLVGPPAGGKTEILRSVKKMLGVDAVLEYDATATTAAGAIKDLDQRLELPRVMLIEEIEKCEEASLRWLLGVLDHRAEIRKTNFKQQIQRSTKLLCIATVNDYDLFCKMMFGALASRFPNHIACPRPSWATIRRIVTREVERVKGKSKWIEPTMRFVKKFKIRDPRKVVAICLCGGDDLLSGTYQKKLINTFVTHATQNVRETLDEGDADAEERDIPANPRLKSIRAAATKKSKIKISK